MTLTDRERQLDEDLKNALAGLVRTEVRHRQLVERMLPLAYYDPETHSFKRLPRPFQSLIRR